MTATSALRACTPNSRRAFRISARFTSSFVVTKSKPALFNIAATIVTSLTGFASLGTFLYAELPMTNATRFSAKAELQPSQVAKTTKTIVRNTPIRPSDEIARLEYLRIRGGQQLLCDANHEAAGVFQVRPSSRPNFKAAKSVSPSTALS